jgi:hypothetical protein
VPAGVDPEGLVVGLFSYIARLLQDPGLTLPSPASPWHTVAIPGVPRPDLSPGISGGGDPSVWTMIPGWVHMELIKEHERADR